MNLASLTIVLVLFGFTTFAAKRLLLYLHVLQQEDYYNGRLVSWIKNKGAFDQLLTFRIFVVGVFWHWEVLPAPVIEVLAAAAFLWSAYTDEDPRISAKKKLVMTARAKRIYVIALIILIASGMWCFQSKNIWPWILNIQFVPFALIVANFLLVPFEKHIQGKFWDEAHEKLQRLNPVVIGITGSFGKTSVKHILGHILKSQAPTLVTPGSVNTPMGIARIVREQLDETHKYFVAEMGAYGKGSVARLCQLSPPSLGILTAIGHAHYERFKTLENVAEAKFELAEAVFQKSGKMIVPESVLSYGAAQRMHDPHKGDFVVVGQDVKILEVQQTMQGLIIKLNYKEQNYDLNVPLYGRHHAENVALAFAGAVALGIAPEQIVNALKSVPQISHRLEVKPQPDGTTIIDDAYNSNPAGFKAALDLLKDLRPANGRSILVTPGMVELGKAHAEEHQKIGEHAAKICDVAVVVAPTRIRAFTRAFIEYGKGRPLVEAKNFDEASKWLEINREPGDVILLENDLPDIHERVPKL